MLGTSIHFFKNARIWVDRSKFAISHWVNQLRDNPSDHGFHTIKKPRVCSWSVSILLIQSFAYNVLFILYAESCFILAKDKSNVGVAMRKSRNAKYRAIKSPVNQWVKNLVYHDRIYMNNDIHCRIVNVRVFFIFHKILLCEKYIRRELQLFFFK